MEKPDVIDTSTISENVALEIAANGIATLQRDADVEYYEPQIKVASETCERLTKALEQARQDTARKIFADLRNYLMPTNEHVAEPIPNFYLREVALNMLESKFLIPPNPVGAGDV